MRTRTASWAAGVCLFLTVQGHSAMPSTRVAEQPSGGAYADAMAVIAKTYPQASRPSSHMRPDGSSWPAVPGQTSIPE